MSFPPENFGRISPQDTTLHREEGTTANGNPLPNNSMINEVNQLAKEILSSDIKPSDEDRKAFKKFSKKAKRAGSGLVKNYVEKNTAIATRTKIVKGVAVIAGAAAGAEVGGRVGFVVGGPAGTPAGAAIGAGVGAGLALAMSKPK